MGSASFVKVLLKNFDVLALPLVSLVYPLYASLKALETKSHFDDQQWLTYWVLHSLLTLFELTFAKVVQLLPFWPFAKLVFTSWLVLPYFSGAAYVYQHFVRPFFSNSPDAVNIWFIPRKKEFFSRPDDVLRAAEKFIKENGTEAFEKLIGKTAKASKSKHRRRTILEEVEAKREAEAVDRRHVEADGPNSYNAIFGDDRRY